MVDNSIQAYINDIQKYNLLTEAEEKELALANTPEARNELVVHNLRLAFSIAITFQNRGISLEDLVQEANMGLIRAAEKFDVTKGYRFSTYAAWWVRQSLSKAITNHSRIIRIPAHIVEANNKIEKAIFDLRVELMRHPTNEEVGARVGKTAKEVATIRDYFTNPTSIDMTFGEDEDATIGSVIEDTMVESPIEYCFSSENEEIIDLVLSTIPEREAKIVKLRIQEGKSLEDTSAAMGLSTERVRQLELKALRKLRHPYRAEILRSVML